LKATSPEFVPPLVEPTDLSSEPRVEQTLEEGQLLAIPRSAEEVVVVGKKHKGMNDQARSRLRPAQDPQDDFVQDRAGSE
jgi:hypothetical protein